jgi:hypothetical protein
MKALRNPMVVGILAAGAFAYAAWTVAAPFLKKPSRSKSTSAQPSKPASKAKATPSPVAGNTATPSPIPSLSLPPLDLAAIHARLPQWIESPARDPFEANRNLGKQPTGPRADQLLSLKAVWRQTGGNLAVLNNQLLTEGAEIAGFTLERIETDAVWVRGTNGLERVGFGSPAVRSPAANPRRPGTPPRQA